MDDNTTPVDYDPFAQQAPTSSAPSAMADTTPVDFDPFSMPGKAEGGAMAMAGDAGAPDFGQDEPDHAQREQDALANSKPGAAIADAGKAAGLSTAAGMSKLPWQLSKVTSLAVGTLPMGYDAITGAFRKGGNDHAASDAWFRTMVDPANAGIEAANDVIADESQDHPGIAKAGAMIGDTASNMSAAVLTGGATEIPSAISMGGKLFAELSGKELAQATLTDAFASSAAASAPTALAHGEETGEQVYNETGDPMAAITAGLGTAASTVATNALPAGVAGSLGERVAAGAVAGGVGQEAQREITNAVMPEDMKQQFSWEDTGWGMLMGAGFGVAFHGTARADPQAVVQKYNDLQRGVEQGDPEAVRTNTVLSQLTTVDGLSPHAMDAAVAGTAAHQAVIDMPHDQLMATSSRYREVYASAAPDMPPEQAAQYAKDTFAAEEQTNVAWDNYLQAQNFNDQRSSTGKVYQQVRDLYAQAEKVVPDVEMQKISRWAFNTSRTPLEVRKALNDAIIDKAAPDYVAENFGDDFHDDGFLTPAAFDKDAASHPDKIPAAWPGTPEVAAALDEARITPYKLDDGRLAVIGDHDAIASVTAHVLDRTGVTPATGDIHGKPNQEPQPEAGLHPERGNQDTGPDEGLEEGDATARGSEAEDRQPVEADGIARKADGEAAQVTRASPLREALADVGDHVAVSERGEVRIAPEAPAAVVERALDTAARDTAADTTDYAEPTPAQAAAGNYRKGGVLFRSTEGDVRVRIENPDGSVRKGKGWSRPVRGAHYGYIPGTKGADGDPLDVFVTRHAHDASRPVAVISQHDPRTGKFDELKVVMGAKNRAEAMRLYAKQYPLGMASKMLPKGEGNVVMMNRAKFAKFVRSGAVDVPPHPVSGTPLEAMRVAREPKMIEAAKPREGKSIEQRVAEAKSANTTEGRMFQKVGVGREGTVTDERSFARARTEYNKIEDTRNGQIMGTDIARELSPEYLADRTKSAEVHEPSSNFVKALYAARLAEPVREGYEPVVTFMAGGTGAGKTTALMGGLGEAARKSDIIYDTNMNSYASSKAKIEQALASGRDAQIFYVYRDPAQALREGALPRAENQRAKYGTGRTVPLSAHIETHLGANETVRRLAEEYAGDERVQIAAVDNSYGRGNAKLIDLAELQQLDHNEVRDRVRFELEDAYKAGEISDETYEGFAGKAPAKPAAEAAAERPVETGPARQPEPEQQAEAPDAITRTEAEAVTHRDAVARHVEKLTARWKSSPAIDVVRNRTELPEAVGKPLEAILGPDVIPKGMYHNGKVYLFADALHDVKDAERTTLHETIGHLGLRGVMGERLNGMLDDIHGSIKDLPAFATVEAGYRDAYGKAGTARVRRMMTEEYLANIAADGSDPGTWSKFVAAFRTWAREHGFVSKWTENDLRVLMAKVADDMRDGRVSLAGLEPPQATFDEETGTVASTYRGAAGEGTITQDYAGHARHLSLGGLDAMVRSSELDGVRALSVGHLTMAKPSDLLRLTRFAAEEGKGVVAVGKESLTRDVLERSGIPFTERPGYWELPASEGVTGPAMFSLRNQAAASPAVEAILKKAVAHPESNLSPWDRMQTALRDFAENIQSGDTFLNLKQNYVDALAPIERYERTQNGGLLLDAAHSAYKSAWMAKNNEQITAGVMRLGVPEYRNGSFEPVAGRTGLLDIFKPLFHTPDGKGLDMLWEGYAMAKRSNELIKQTNEDGTSREKLLSQDEIDTLLDLEKQYPVFKKVFDDYQQFNKQLLDLAVDRGTLSKETADLWSQNMYVPFYRALEDSKNDSNEWRQGKGVSGKKVSSMKLYGSDKAVEPIIENIIKNTGAILDKVYSNEAMRRVVALTDGIGMERLKIPMKGVELSLGEIEKALGRIGYQLGGKKPGGGYMHHVAQQDMDKLIAFFKQSKPQGPDIVSVYEKGKPVYYRVTDENLYRAVTAFNDIGKFDQVLGAILGVPKKLLTLGVTLDPRFMYRNLLRDAISVWAQTGTNPNVFKGMMKNSAEVWQDKEFLNKLRVAGYNGNEYFRVNEMREFMRDMHGSNWTLLNSPLKLARAYHKIGFVSEQLNRVNVARHILAKGGSMAEAAWQAQNTLNFQKRGDSRAMQLLIRAVPFLNARIQGLNRLYEGVTGRDVTVDRKRALVSFALKSAGIMLAGMALSLHNKDDPRYERIPDEAKDTYYHFFIGDQHFVLPKPFELGAILTTIPERILRRSTGNDNVRTFVESLQRVATGIFSFNPIPQIAQPLIQDWANKDSFSGAPIVNQSLSNLEPTAQYTPRTSPTIKAVAQNLPSALPDALRSPERLEHLYRGYGAQVGMYLLSMSDAAVRAMGNAPAQPSSRHGNKLTGAIVGTFGLGSAETDPRNKYVQQLYDAQDNADRAAATVNAYLKQGHIEEARETMQQNKTALSYRNMIHSVASQMKTLREQETLVYQSPVMSDEQKRDKLDQINKVKRRILERAAPVLEIASDYQSSSDPKH